MIYVITFDPTKISIDWAHQNDRQNLIFVKAIMKLSRKWPEIVYDRNHLFGLGSDTETETENWPKL